MFSEKNIRTNAYHDNINNDTILEYKDLECPNCTAVGRLKFIEPEDIDFHTHEVKCVSCGSSYCIGLKYYPIQLNKDILERIGRTGLSLERFSELNKIDLEILREITMEPLIYSYELYEVAGKILGKTVDELTSVELVDYKTYEKNKIY